MNKTLIWKYVFLGKRGAGAWDGGGDPQDVDMIVRGVVTKWWCLITKGRGGQESGKSD